MSYHSLCCVYAYFVPFLLTNIAMGWSMLCKVGPRAAQQGASYLMRLNKPIIYLLSQHLLLSNLAGTLKLQWFSSPEIRGYMPCRKLILKGRAIGIRNGFLLWFGGLLSLFRNIFTGHSIQLIFYWDKSKEL